MKTPAQADLQRWSDEVARDPRSLAFLPLARAYRRQGLREAATQLCLRGLEAYPSHVEAHGLLALLYLEAGDSTKAADEWSMVLRIDKDNFDALRGMGFCYLEQDQLSRARQTLERAALLRPSDPAVQEALRVLGTRQELTEQGIGRTTTVATSDDPWAAPAEGSQAGGTVEKASPEETSAEEASAAAEPWAETAGVTPAGSRTEAARPATPAPAAGASSVPQGSVQFEFAGVPDDPTRLFDDLLMGGPLLGALLVDAQGLVLAGRLTEGVAGDGSVLGAVLGGAIDEATRTTEHLSLGGWRGILLEAEHALLHLAPVGDHGVVVLAAQRNAPAGWMLRAAAQAAEQAARYMEAYT